MRDGCGQVKHHEERLGASAYPCCIFNVVRMNGTEDSGHSGNTVILGETPSQDDDKRRRGCEQGEVCQMKEDRGKGKEGVVQPE